MPGLTRELSTSELSSSVASGSTCATHKPKRRAKAMKRQSSVTDADFSLKGIPKFEDFVAMGDLPDVLMVYDRGNYTNLCPNGKGREGVLYKRAFPKGKINTHDPRRGCLFLDPANAIAEGRRAPAHP